jgi:hypothetical protein
MHTFPAPGRVGAAGMHTWLLLQSEGSNMAHLSEQKLHSFADIVVRVLQLPMLPGR